MKKRLLILALVAMSLENSMFANFFTQNSGACCTPPPAYYKPGCCDQGRCCRKRIKGRPRWACCCKPKCWSLRRWLFGDDCCKAKRPKKCCWPNQYKTCTPCQPTIERCDKGACGTGCGNSRTVNDLVQPVCETLACQTVECTQPCSYQTLGQYEDVSYENYNGTEYQTEYDYSESYEG